MMMILIQHDQVRYRIRVLLIMIVNRIYMSMQVPKPRIRLSSDEEYVLML